MNRTFRTFVAASFYAMLTVWPAAAESAPGDAWPRLQVAHSWFANSHADARFMPQGIEGMHVSPDGTTFTNIFWEEGGGNVAVIGTDGDVHPRPHMPGYFGWGHNGGRAVAANSKYVFFSQQYNNEGDNLKDINNWPPAGKVWYGISRRSREDIGTGPPFAGGKGGKDSPSGCFLPIHEIDSSAKESESHIRSLFATETEVFVACAIDSSIKVYGAEQMTLKRSWEVKDAWHIAVDGEGALWVAIGEDATEIHRYDPQGKRLPQTITLPPGSRSGSFCIDSKGRMLIGDVGENEWVLIYSDITTGMGSGQSPFCIYRLAPETDGEVMIPCVVWSNSNKYPHAPEGHWLWRDTNGNGQPDAGEYTKTDVHDAYGGNSAFIDARGDIWMTCWGPLRKITFEGLDSHGIPTYAPDFETIEAPKPYGGIRRVRYDMENDVMYLAGTSDDKTHHWKSMGVHLCRYDNWSKGNRDAAWHVICTHQPDSNCEPISFDVAGDYVFVAIAERGKVGEREISRGHISVYHKQTGAVVGYIEPPNDWGVGWMDMTECLSVHRRENGEYLILQEEDGRSKNLLHRWTPDTSSKAP